MHAEVEYMKSISNHMEKSEERIETFSDNWANEQEICYNVRPKDLLRNNFVWGQWRVSQRLTTPHQLTRILWNKLIQKHVIQKMDVNNMCISFVWPVDRNPFLMQTTIAKESVGSWIFLRAPKATPMQIGLPICLHRPRMKVNIREINSKWG